MRLYNGVYQQDIKECGTACLVTVCKYYGCEITLSQIRDRNIPPIDGYSIEELVDIACYLEIEAVGVYGTQRELENSIRKEEIEFPVIAHIEKEKGQYHYIVIWEKIKEYFLIFDPVEGNKKISQEEFYKYWTGYIICFIKERGYYDE